MTATGGLTDALAAALLHRAGVVRAGSQACQERGAGCVAARAGQLPASWLLVPPAEKNLLKNDEFSPSQTV